MSQFSGDRFRDKGFDHLIRRKLLELSFHHLAGIVMRHRFDQVDSLRDFERWKALLAEIRHVHCRELRITRWQNAGSNPLAQNIVRHPENCDFDNLGQLRNDIFNFLGADPFASRFDKLAFTLDNENKTVRINAGEIARVKFAIFEIFRRA